MWLTTDMSVNHFIHLIQPWYFRASLHVLVPKWVQFFLCCAVLISLASSPHWILKFFRGASSGWVDSGERPSLVTWRIFSHCTIRVTGYVLCSTCVCIARNHHLSYWPWLCSIEPPPCLHRRPTCPFSCRIGLTTQCSSGAAYLKVHIYGPTHRSCNLAVWSRWARTAIWERPLFTLNF